MGSLISSFQTMAALISLPLLADTGSMGCTRVNTAGAGEAVDATSPTGYVEIGTTFLKYEPQRFSAPVLHVECL